MLPLVKLKQEMSFSEEIADIVNVLKEIAASQFHHLEIKRQSFEIFTEILKDFFQSIHIEGISHPFLHGASVRKGIFMVTSDEGFVGGLNSSIIERGLKESENADSLKSELIVIGEQGATILEEMGRSFLYFRGITNDVNYLEAERIKNYIVQEYYREKLGRIVMVYPKFVSFTYQSVDILQLLPCVDIESDIAKGTDDEDEMKYEEKRQLIAEPSVEKILDYLIKVWVGKKVYDVYWHSKLSELSARAIHMEASSQELETKKKKVKFQYFRAVHEMLDKSIREIFAARIGRERSEAEEFV